MDARLHSPCPPEPAAGLARPAPGRRASRAAWTSLAVGAAVLGLKFLSWHLTGSVALYSDALESIVNVAAASFALFAVRVAARPADEEHPFGHSKAEYFSAVVEGALILVAAISIVASALGRLLHPGPLESVGLGALVAIVASAVNGLLAAWLVRVGRELRSPAIEADGLHVYTDVATSIGVLAGIGIATATGWWILDPLLAIGVALNIVRVGWRLVRESVGGLMDEALPPAEKERIRAILQPRLQSAQQVHQLLTRRAGHRTFVQFHLVVPATMTVQDAHEICEDLERALATELGEVQVSIHVEPEGEAVPSPFVAGGDA
ncbi:MAG: cation transporter [Planctomycetes bacterium]|nr:cation transporter [Planctomycetota bacterium]